MQRSGIRAATGIATPSVNPGDGDDPVMQTP
jgi:hypothetical protein